MGNTPAADGSPGELSDEIRTLQVNSKGWELDQTFQKALIGALTLDQIVNNYLQPCKLDAEGKPYTSMEHAWDEAFGYLYGQEPDATADLSSPGGAGTLLNKYLKKVSEGDVAPGISEPIFKAFVKGRQAIVDGDYETRDAQAKIIQENLSKVIGAMTINYLKSYLSKKNDSPADAIHALSEGYGFMLSLPFTNNGADEPYMSQEVVDAILPNYENFWTVKDDAVESHINEIVTRFGFDESNFVAPGGVAPAGDDAGAGGDDDGGAGDDAGASDDDGGGDDSGQNDDDGGGDDGAAEDGGDVNDGGVGSEDDAGAGDNDAGDNIDIGIEEKGKDSVSILDNAGDGGV